MLQFQAVLLDQGKKTQACSCQQLVTCQLLICSLAQTYTCTASSILGCSFIQLPPQPEFQQSLRGLDATPTEIPGLPSRFSPRTPPGIYFSSPPRPDRGYFYREITKLASDALYQQVANLQIPLSQIPHFRPAKTDYLHCVHLCDQRAATQSITCLALSSYKTLYGIF